MLTIQNAMQYAERIICGATAINATMQDIDGIAFIAVYLQTPYGLLTMDCWIECGRLYGEY